MPRFKKKLPIKTLFLLRYAIAPYFQWQDIPARWATKDNLHITLAFLGGRSDRELEEINSLVKEEASRHNPFEIVLEKIVYGPTKENPRMIWVAVKSPEDLLNLQKGIEKTLTDAELYTPENREFSPHITLARLKEWQFRQIEPEERPTVNEEIDLRFTVNSVDLMESALKRTGSEYKILESFPLSIP
ncbi:MAG: RNA 2',3'-cyclic phosphodiesterase [Candidatus Wildermuthbacteria bacterium]|nr:RNA 2',3'-cyclic phosphodiesterase [Candidatus Wildermuthbacteria bacterium]